MSTTTKKKLDLYCQCTMHRPGLSKYADYTTAPVEELGETVSVRHAWIPKKFAVKNEHVSLMMEDGEWENGWKIVSKGQPKERDPHVQHHKSHRDGTDNYRNKDGAWVTRKEKRKKG